MLGYALQNKPEIESTLHMDANNLQQPKCLTSDTLTNLQGN